MNERKFNPFFKKVLPSKTNSEILITNLQKDNSFNTINKSEENTQEIDTQKESSDIETTPQINNEKIILEATPINFIKNTKIEDNTNINSNPQISTPFNLDLNKENNQESALESNFFQIKEDIQQKPSNFLDEERDYKKDSSFSWLEASINTKKEENKEIDLSKFTIKEDKKENIKSTPEINPFQDNFKKESIENIKEEPLTKDHSEDLLLRTMESDLKTIKENGGLEPHYIKIDEKELSHINPIFKKEDIKKEELILDKKSDKSKLGHYLLVFLIWTLSLAIITSLGIVIYLFSQDFIAQNKAETKQEEVEIQQKENSYTTKEILPHRSAFNFPPGDKRVSVFKLNNYTLVEILAGLTNQIKILSNSSSSEPIQEIVIGNDDGQIIWSKFISGILPELEKSPLITNSDKYFEKDFTTFLSKENNKYFPGYIVKIKNKEELLPLLKDIENSSIKNLFIDIPEGNGKWNESKLGNDNIRFISYSKSKPSSINYGIIDNNFILTTNLQGFLDSLDLIKK